jgi:hypothetical protein
MLIDAAGFHSEPTRGRSSTLWSATAQQQTEENEISEADLDEFSPQGASSAYSAFSAHLFGRVPWG